MILSLLKISFIALLQMSRKRRRKEKLKRILTHGTFFSGWAKKYILTILPQICHFHHLPATKKLEKSYQVKCLLWFVKKLAHSLLKMFLCVSIEMHLIWLNEKKRRKKIHYYNGSNQTYLESIVIQTPLIWW